MKHLLILVLIVSLSACCTKNNKVTGPYLGQELPGDSAQLFAPGIINDGIATRDITFTPDGKEIYFGKNIGNSSFSTILFCKQTENGWTDPEVVSFAQNAEYIFIEPFISPDGTKLFFVSNMGNEITDANRFVTDIWTADRENDGWGTPYKLDTTINSKYPEFYPSVAENGNLYFTREINQQNFIYKSEYRNGKYEKPVLLPKEVNCGRARFNTTIAKDESFMIIPCIGMPDSYGGTDYYISFFDKEKGWSEAQNMGDQINTPTTHQYSAGFSPDGKFLFFMSSGTNLNGIKSLTYENLQLLHNSPENGNSNIYWIKADFIEDLKKQAIFTEKDTK
ncbi:hypothetical protein [uncultured Draconibacterium sp.]|uniref:TolB family protein n=1 Tax=uncultured Draconibacterium sp. TaxID=1573823 RepID=UPI003217A6BA